MEQPLVSIVVITYNSARTVIETLDSAKNQTYKNIELIVSDDCSTDNTVEICRNWIAGNKDRFVRTELITVERNTGVPGNCNRGIRKCSSEWIKLIAGDDILLDNCVYDCITYVQKNKDVELLYTPYYQFSQEGSDIIRRKLFPNKKFNDEFNTKSPQFNTFLRYAPNIAPALFWKKNLIVRMGYFDERYTLFEDFPMIAKVLYEKNKIYFLGIPTVLYRINHQSITKTEKTDVFYKRKFMDQLFSYRKEVLYSYIKRTDFSFWINEFFYVSTYYLSIYILRNRKNVFTKFVRRIYILLNPFTMIKMIKFLVDRYKS